VVLEVVAGRSSCRDQPKEFIESRNEDDAILTDDGRMMRSLRQIDRRGSRGHTKLYGGQREDADE